MQKWAESFYKSQSWQKCRKAYYKKAAGLCELCLLKGIIKPGEIVHHKIELTKNNIGNPNVTLSFDNLMLVCRDCHAQLHAKKIKRYKTGKNGEVTLL